MSEPVPIMNEFTHDRLTEALLHAQQGRPSEARDAINRALDQLDEDDAQWENHTGARGRVAYGRSHR